MQVFNAATLKNYLIETIGSPSPVQRMELEKLFVLIPHAKIYLDQCQDVLVPIRGDYYSDRRSAEVRTIKSTFRDFPSGKKLGRFIARITENDQTVLPAIGADVMFPIMFMELKPDGIGYGDSGPIAIASALSDFFVKKATNG